MTELSCDADPILDTVDDANMADADAADVCKCSQSFDKASLAWDKLSVALAFDNELANEWYNDGTQISGGGGPIELKLGGCDTSAQGIWWMNPPPDDGGIPGGNDDEKIAFPKMSITYSFP